MLPAPIHDSTLAGGRRRATRSFRRRMAWLSVLATVAAGLVATSTAPVGAVQASGDEVPTLATGWSWTYATVFNYAADGTNVTINENVTYTVAGVETFDNQPAYKLNLTGTITGGNGAAAIDGVGNVTLSNFSGTVSGTRFMRRSDFALLQENQKQALNATAKLGIISQGITANINLAMTPRRGWRLIQFPTAAGNSWINDVDVDYAGGFSYDAGSIGGSGADNFDGTFEFNGPTTVADETITGGAGSISTRRSREQSSDGNTRSTMWFSPTHKNAARLLLEIPLDGGSLTLDQKLSSAAVPAPSTTLTSTVTPSLTCAGDQVTVSGRLSSGQSGVPVSVSLDRSPVTRGAATTASTTTTSGGNYTATLQAPADADGYQRTNVRGSWGVITSAGAASSVATLLVTPRNCSSLSYTGDTSAAQGDTATVRAVLTDATGASTAGRTVTFSLSGGASVDATTNASGVAQAQLAVNGAPRSATVTASYAGAAGLEAATASAPFTVTTIPTTTTVIADPGTVTVGEPVRFAATVAAQHGASPSGTVSFSVDGAGFGQPVAVVDGQATSAALSTLATGFHVVTAAYNGSADHAPSASGAVQFRVREPLLGTSTSATVSPTSTVYGQPVTMSATVTTGSGTPTGEVVFTSGGTVVGSAGVDANGVATVDVTDLAVGSHQIIATYSGDDVYAGSAASPRSVSVAKAPVDVALDGPSGTAVTGEPLAYTATVAVQAPGAGIPSGSVQLVVDGSDVGSPVPLVNGVAAFPALSTLGAGSHTVKVEYAGSSEFSAGSDQVTQVVAKADTTTSLQASPSPSVQDENVQFTAVVSAVAPGSGAPEGTVRFFEGSTLLGAVPLSADGAGSIATLDLDDLAAGAHEITATYGGDGDYESSASTPFTHTVIAGTAVVATTTSLMSATNPSSYGTPLRFRAAVATADGIPSGTVQFSVDGADLGDPVEIDGDGVALSPSIPDLLPGDHTVIASFVGATGFAGSGDILVQTIGLASPDVMLSSSSGSSAVGEAVHFTAQVDAVLGVAPSGVVQFSIDGQPFGPAVALVDGRASSGVRSDLNPGDHLVSVLYSGDERHAPGTATFTQHVTQVATGTTITVPPTATTYGDPVLLTAKVTAADGSAGVPTGSVTFLSDGVAIGTVALAAPTGPSDGLSAIAQLTTSALSAGPHTLRAVYAGDGQFQGSTSTDGSVSVAKQVTAIKADPAAVKLLPLGLPLGQLRVTVTNGSGAPVAGVPVVFTAGTKALCTSMTNESGIAVCDAQSQILALTLALGYTATFNGDANHLSSTARGALLK